MDNDFSSELNNILNSPKCNLNDYGKVVALNNGKIGIISDNKINIYDKNNFEKLYEIKNEEENMEFINMIELDNKDIIVQCEKYVTKFMSFIKIYKLINNKYALLQIIKNDLDDYKEKEYRINCKIINMCYQLKSINKISDNRFISISNLGFKIYSYLNKESKYSKIAFNQDFSYTYIKGIYAINNDELYIFASKYKSPGLRSPEKYYELFIFKFSISQNTVTKKVWHNKFNSLDLTNSIIIKNKYIIFLINEEFYIYDTIKDKQIKPKFRIKSKDKDEIGKVYNWESLNNDILLYIKKEGIYYILFNESLYSLKLIIKYDFDKDIEKLENINGFYHYNYEYIDKDNKKIKNIDFYY